ncbi:hypothetical protein E2C01_066211 [Portunus trituberculatus]|uniref:Uncharacterized protein n=1 Tax=Portunus trituberculatus TaxID=210409 RepID=A0A5B7HQC0_PORTR|nr:hypothetical protein [Portunus trituberculatus]
MFENISHGSATQVEEINPPPGHGSMRGADLLTQPDHDLHTISPCGRVPKNQRLGSGLLTPYTYLYVSTRTHHQYPKREEAHGDMGFLINV